MTGRRDAGAATVWVAALLLVVVTATVLVVGGATAVTARHAAQLAADLAALAGAGRIGVDDAGVCAAADRVAAANGARLRRCEVTPTGARTGQVRVEVDRRAWWGGLTWDATARARAARLDGTGRPGTAGAVYPAGVDPPRCGGAGRVAALPLDTAHGPGPRRDARAPGLAHRHARPTGRPWWT